MIGASRTVALRRSTAAIKAATVAPCLSTQSINRTNNQTLVQSSSSRYSHSLPSVTLPVVNPRNTIVKLLQNIGSRNEIEQYLKYYSSIDSPKFAVIKVGGGIIAEELEILSESLSFLTEVGLFPVVIHGAGPQLNDELAKRGIVSDYIGGMRITTPEILAVARQVFLETNLKLVRALEAKGVRARPIVSGVFSAEFLDRSQYQYVGSIGAVDTRYVLNAIDSGCVPVLTCMGESSSGQILNINADVAAQELAKSLKPVKIIYLSQNGGINDQNDQLMPLIDLDTDFERLMVEPWFRHGNRLKLKEIKTLLDAMPVSSSVAITSAANLPKELFTHKGSGTMVKRSEKILQYESLDEINREKLTHLIESSFDGKLNDGYLDQLRPHIHRIYLSESYRAIAIITKDRSDPNSLPYLDKFAVAKASQSEGSGQTLWNVITREVPTMFWRSRANNPINNWYFERSQGSVLENPWRIFWYGVNDYETVLDCIAKAKSKPTSIDRSAPFTQPDPKVLQADHSIAAGLGSFAGSRRSYSTMASQRRGFGNVRSFSTSARPAGKNTKPGRVGLIGARGHTGSELIKLIAQHPYLSVTVASSRALKGQTMRSISPDLPASVEWGSLQFTDLKPEDLASQPVDVWVLALPNDLAAPFVTALDAAKSTAKIVDLSADHRFNSSWQYGFPEHHGYRDLIAQSSRVANPGCYATGAQTSLLPLASIVDASYEPTVFGVSGYSGAGTTPSRKNDLKELTDNLMPYALLNHMHEREVSAQLKPFLPNGIRFMPHVASWFRGIALTTAVRLSDKSVTKNDITEMYRQYYANEPLIKVVDDIPEVKDIANKHHVAVGGFQIDNKTGRLVVTATIDNLLKGAATQCMQNINIMMDYPEYASIIKQ